MSLKFGIRRCAATVVAVLMLAAGAGLRAQQPWNYASVQEMHLDDAFLANPPDSLVHKLSRYAKVPIVGNVCYRLEVVSPKKGRFEVRFLSDSCSFTLRSQQAELLLPYLVSGRYWDARFRQLQQWTFVSMDNGDLLHTDTADHRHGRYSAIAWLRYDYLPDPEDPVRFTVRTNTRENQPLGLAALQRLAVGGAFTTDAGMDAYEQNQRDVAAAEQARRSALQHHLDSLDRIGHETARLTDSIATAIRNDSLALAEQALRNQVQATKERMNREQIFLMSLRTAKSDYMFGLEFNFYNCFPKSISKIEISVVPVNDRDQVQADQFNRSVRTIRCMGPIRPGEPAQYTFDELFWDDRGRIRYMRVSSITFHFPDGTRRAFNGYQNVLKHILNR